MKEPTKEELGDEVVTIFENGGVKIHCKSHVTTLKRETLRKLADAAAAIAQDYRDSPDIKD